MKIAGLNSYEPIGLIVLSIIGLALFINYFSLLMDIVFSLKKVIREEKAKEKN